MARHECGFEVSDTLQKVRKAADLERAHRPVLSPLRQKSQYALPGVWTTLVIRAGS